MNSLNHPRRRIGATYVSPSLQFPRVYIRKDLSLSTKLVLLVVIPLALTLAVTLPLTVTGLNRLASVTSTESLEDEILLVNKQTALFEEEIHRAANRIAQDPILLAAVRASNTLDIRTILHSSRVQLGFQHLEVADENGARLGHEHQVETTLDQMAKDELGASGMVEINTTKIVQTSGGWFLISVRPLYDAGGFLGSVAVGRVIDFNTLAEINFNRSDPVLVLLDDDGEAASASYPWSDETTHFHITTDPEMVRRARSGQVTIGSAVVNGRELPTAYVPVELGSGPRSVFAITLTKSPVVGLRDQLIANHVVVTAALALLVLGVGYTVTRAITRRILRLRDGAVEIGNGNLSHRIEENTNDEMGTLAREFNRMSDRLSEKTTQLEQANRDLEIRVFERTEELQQSNVQLLEAQSQLVRTEKFGALGELSAGVAHDLRNPLGAIRNGIFFVKSKLAKSEALAAEPKVAEYLQVMDERIAQCDKIIEDLISFTRISSPNYSTVNLGDLLDSTLSGIDIPDGITLKNKYVNDSAEVEVDSLQLQRVFTNLIVNAYEAMLDGGSLTIDVQTMGPSAEVTITDTGPGISPEGLEKIFEPLFTTKIQGTGLGLAVCQQVLVKHSGSLEVHSELGVGTTFRVSFPLVPQAKMAPVKS